MKANAVVFLMVVFSTFAVAPVAGQVTPAAVEIPTVTVSGEAVITAVPDQAWVSVGAESRSKISKDAQQRNAEAMNAIQEKLLALGVGKDAIRTAAVDLQPEFDYVNGKQVARGFLARNTIEVRIDDLAKLGGVLDAVVASGATSLNGLRFDVKNRSAVEQQALQAAVTNATEKAHAVASGAKRTVDRVIRIEEVFVGGGVPEPVMMRAMAQRADVQTPIAAGQIEIRAQVRLTAEIK